MVELKAGFALKDTEKQKWTIVDKLGSGGCGAVYTAIKETDQNHQFAIKIEPIENATLDNEIYFYKKHLIKEKIDKFIRTRKIPSQTLSLPSFVASGTHSDSSVQLRFLVMQKFGQDLWEILNNVKYQVPVSTVYRLGWQIMNSLEYVHACGYVHNDLKAENILLGDPDTIFLVDFGLLSPPSSIYKHNSALANIGTWLYAARDLHLGIPTRRGDLEILLYNLIEWCGGKLPWDERQIMNFPERILKTKQDFMKDSERAIKRCFRIPVPSSLLELMRYIKSLRFDAKLDYKKVRSFFENELKKMDKENTGKLEFEQPEKRCQKKKLSVLSSDSLYVTCMKPSKQSRLDQSSGGSDLKFFSIENTNFQN